MGGGGGGDVRDEDGSHNYCRSYTFECDSILK